LALCSECPKRDNCRNTCEAVEKAITGRHKTASLKPKTYTVDFTHIEDVCKKHNRFQKEMLDAIAKMTSGLEEKMIMKLTLQEAVDKVLGGKERRMFRLFIKQYTQTEIAQKLRISQPRVNSSLQKIKRKLKSFLKGL
jgi:RNA polymerase sigma factor (sigma-70 family)